jgi:hypothetical protein
MKNLRELAFLMTNGEEGRYNEEFKKKFKTVGLKAMKELACLLELKEFDVHFNPAGIACSGDLTLIGMWEEGKGIYITMNKDFPNKPWGDVLYRTVKHMKDWTGGGNNYFEFDLLGSPNGLKERIMNLRG